MLLLCWPAGVPLFFPILAYFAAPRFDSAINGIPWDHSAGPPSSAEPWGRSVRRVVREHSRILSGHCWTLLLQGRNTDRDPGEKGRALYVKPKRKARSDNGGEGEREQNNNTHGILRDHSLLRASSAPSRKQHHGQAQSTHPGQAVAGQGQEHGRRSVS